MTMRLENRLRRIESLMRPRAESYVIRLPVGHDRAGEDHRWAVAEAVDAHRRATRYHGPVVIMPETLTVEAWERRYCGTGLSPV